MTTFVAGASLPNGKANCGTGKTHSRLSRASGKSRGGRGVTGTSLAHVHTFDQARDPDRKGQRSAQVAEQAEAEGVEQGGEYNHN